MPLITIDITRSTMLTQVRYDEATSTLTVVFANGGEYEYENVPKKVFDELIAAESEGKYFTKHIKNSYRYRKI